MVRIRAKSSLRDLREARQLADVLRAGRGRVACYAEALTAWFPPQLPPRQRCRLAVSGSLWEWPIQAVQGSWWNVRPKKEKAFP